MPFRPAEAVAGCEMNPVVPDRQPLDSSLVTGSSDDEVLRGYVALVRTWRGGCTTALRFRQDDLVVLVGILGTDPEDIERRLIAITGCTRSKARHLRRLLLVSIAALPVGFAGLVSASTTVTEAAPTDHQEVPVASATYSGAMDMPARSRPHSTPTQVSTSTAVTPREPSATATTPENAGAERPAASPPPLPGSEGSVSIPSLGIELPIFEGGQSVIDEGVAAHYTAAGWLEPTGAGAVGTYWLAAHHVTHGAPFGALPGISLGAQVLIRTLNQTFTYTVTSTEVVEHDAGFGPVYGADPSASVILLQTCVDSTRRLLVHGTLTGTT